MPLRPPFPAPAHRAAWRRSASGRSAWVALTLALSLTAARADELADVKALSARGEHAAALLRIDAQLRTKPADPSWRFQRGVALMDLGRDADALALFTELSQLHPELPDPYNNLALLHAKAGRLDEALAALTEALRCEPGHRTALGNLGQLHLMLAARAWDRLAASGPIDLAQRERLQAVRALLAPAAAPAR